MWAIIYPFNEKGRWQKVAREYPFLPNCGKNFFDPCKNGFSPFILDGEQVSV
jgi:hypothetical protein